MISRRKALLAALAALALVAAACRREAAPPGPKLEKGGTIVFGADQELTGFNVGTSKDNGFAGGIIVRNIWPSAYRIRPDFSAEPYVLDGPAKVLSKSPFVVEWKIKEDAGWDDGTPVSADDFEAVYLICNGKVDPGEPSTKDKDTGKDVTTADCAGTTGYDQIVKFEKVDSKTARATFEPPFAEIEALFGALAPAHELKKRGKTAIDGFNTGFDENPGPSSGPFKFKEWVRGDHVTIVRNDKWWGEKATLDSITFRFLPESVTQPDALRNNEVQMIYPQPQLDLVETVGQIPGVNSGIGFGPIFEHLTFNFKNEFLKTLEVRQAIALGVDRDAIVTALMKPFSQKASRLDNRIFMGNQKGFEAHGKESAKRDVAKAKTLLEKAGFTKGADGIYAKGGKKLSLRISTTAGNALREQQGQLIQAQLKEVGIDIRIDNSPSKILFGQRLPGGDFDIINFAWVGTPFPASGNKAVYETDGGSNYTGHSNTKVDDLLKKANAEPDFTKRAGLLNDADELLWQDLPNLPLYQKPTFLAFYSKYANIEENTTTESPFWNTEEWGLRAKAV